VFCSSVFSTRVLFYEGSFLRGFLSTRVLFFLSTMSTKLPMSEEAEAAPLIMSEGKQEPKPLGLVLPATVLPTPISLLPIPATTAPPTTPTGLTGTRAGEGVGSETGQEEKIGAEGPRKEALKKRAERKATAKKEQTKLAKKAQGKEARRARSSLVGAKKPANAKVVLLPKDEAKQGNPAPDDTFKFDITPRSRIPRLGEDRMDKKPVQTPPPLLLLLIVNVIIDSEGARGRN
jgi:hypothetical protein